MHITIRHFGLAAVLALLGCSTSTPNRALTAAWRDSAAGRTDWLLSQVSPGGNLDRGPKEPEAPSRLANDEDDSRVQPVSDEDLQADDETVNRSDLEVPPSPVPDEPIPDETAPMPRLANGEFPIDLVTVLRLVNANSPTIGVSQARVREAYARAEAADFLWLPNLTAGSTYNRFDGQTQNQRGEIFSVSRANLFNSGGLALTMDTSEAFYRPLIERRLASAAQRQYSATLITAELEAVLAYFDLLQIQELLILNRDTLEKGEQLLEAAVNAQQAKLDRSPGDVNRVRTEVLLRKQERADLSGRAAAASARLGRLLLLDPGVRLTPQLIETLPITLIDPDMPLPDLLVLAAYNRQELAAVQDQFAAAWERVRKAQHGPWLPKVQVTDQVGSFGGGINGDLQDFQGRNALTAMIYWELRNFGYGNIAETRERQAAVDQIAFQSVELQARVAADVVESAEMAAAKLESVSFAREAVAEASELYRINQEGTFNVVDAKNLFDALRPLQALQFLHQARQNFIGAVMDYNRAEYRLNAALGCPSETAFAAEQ